MIKLGISGACGRMGKIIGKLAFEDTKNFKVEVALERKNHPLVGKNYAQILGYDENVIITDSPEDIKNIDVLVEFSNPQATLEHLEWCQKFKKKMVIGTTGFNSSQLKKIKKASSKIGILLSPNMSLGVNLLFKILEKVSGILCKDYDVEIIDIHHRYKKDAPSGTGKKFSQIISKYYKKEIPVHSLRIGEVFGDHYIIFSGNKERIEFIHRAVTREVFAQGALKASIFIHRKQKGFYTMQDLLKL